MSSRSTAPPNLDYADMSVADLVAGRMSGNPRVMPEHEAEALRGSISRYGLVEPVVFNKRTRHVVGGHQRLDALVVLGQKRARVVVVDLDEPDEKALNLALNRIHGAWDWPKLQAILDELASIDTTLPAAAGFTDEELKRLGLEGNLLTLEIEQARDELRSLASSGIEIEPDVVPEPPEKATTRRGDIWMLGDHRLMCGDSASPTDLDRLLAGAPIHLVNTDPPYNVKVEPRSNNAIAAGLSSFTTTHHQKLDVERHPEKAQPTTRKLRAKDRPLENDFVSDEAFAELLGKWFNNLARVLQPGRAFYIWGGYSNCGNYPPALKAAGLYFSQAIIWNKLHPVLTRKDYLGAHEWCFYGWKEGAAHEFFGPNNIPDLWEVKKVTPQSMVHLTEKPVELAARACIYSSHKGENALDLFGGSGSTLMACEHTGRRAFLMELDPLYCDVILQRWINLTGKQPTLEADGKTFEKVSALRKRRGSKAAANA